MKLQPPLRFASTFRFVDSETFHRLTDAKSRLGASYVGQYEVMPTHGLTVGLMCCQGVGIRSDQGVGVAHLLPKAPHNARLTEWSPLDFQQLPGIALQTGQVMTRLGGLSAVRAFLTGGILRWQNSYDYGRFLYNLLHQAGIPLTAFWGQPEHGYLRIHHEVPQDTWMLNCADMDPDPPASLETLKKRFQVIQMAPGDTLELGGTAYTDLSFNTELMA